MKNIFMKLNINGSVLLTLKSNDKMFIQFQNEIKKGSFGICVVITNQIQKLPSA